MSTNATHMLVSSTLDFLRRHSPFDRMEAEPLRFLAERLKLAYYPKDTAILTPEMGPPRIFYILQRGKVVARQAGEVNVTEYTTLTQGPGECFPIGAVTAQRPSTNTYIALDDVFCYQLDAEDYFDVMRRSSVFNLFCTQYIASLLNQSRQQLQVQFAQRAAEQQSLNTPLASLVSREPLAVTADVPLRQVLETMGQQRLGSMIIVDEEKKPVGIFTQSDLLHRVVLPEVSLETPIAQVMSKKPHTLPDNAYAYDAAMAMAMHGIRHVLVVNGSGQLRGVISERDLFTLQRVGLRQIRQSVESAPNLETLRQTSNDVRQLAVNMLAQGVGAEQVTQFISALNDTITRRVLELNLDKHDLYGVDWAWLSFGSEGREEQTFSTDQDNGIIYICPDLMDKEQLQLRLLDFARDVNADLDQCGFPLCEGNIMASNAELCLTLEEWQEKFTNWIRRPDPSALLNATIFFDFRVLYGNTNLGERLRSWLFSLTSNNPAFLHMMAKNALDVAPPLGKIRDFVTDLDSLHPGTIDLKKYGARLFVDVARIYAMATGVYNTNTVQRLRFAGKKQGINAEEMGAMIDSFNFIQLLRLRHQHLENENGQPGDNRINPDQFNELDRRILKESFRQARKLQTRLKLDYQV
ncbi:MAG: CBS domain-containing protein [Betaproteobacteria bacterium]|nr:CBS domain-containing protein [Betaproteobacteria bacterium]